MPEVEPHPDFGLQYGQTWGSVGTSRQARQWPDLEASRVMDRSIYEDHHQRELGGGPASPFSHPSLPLPYDGFASPQNRDNVEYYGPPQGIKRPRSEVDGDDDEEELDSSVQVPAGKRQRRTSGIHPQNTAPTRRVKQFKAEKKLKAISRPARKDRVQGTKGAEHNPKGMTRINPHGQLEWQEAEESDWGTSYSLMLSFVIKVTNDRVQDRQGTTTIIVRSS